jgi:dynein heavy chain
LNEFFETYNIKNKNAQIKYVLFDYFIDHILRVARILRQPRGNVVLIGHGGSGKQSVCQIASFITTLSSDSFDTFTVGSDLNVKKFKEIIKGVIRKAADKKRCLLLTDNNVGYDFILENINNFLNNGEIPNLLEMDYAAKLDERSTIKTYEDFVEATRKNLHVLFCTSPIGDLLRIRMRRFPALINCCSLDWFMAWPTEALLSCCKESFKPIKLIEDEKKEKVVKMVVEAHKQIEKLTDYFYQSLGRKVYVTPKSFLDMVNLMINILEKKKKESDKKINILENGTTKLETTEKDIEKLNVTITELMPKITKQLKKI